MCAVQSVCVSDELVLLSSTGVMVDSLACTQCDLQGVYKRNMQRQWTGFGLNAKRSNFQVSSAFRIVGKFCLTCKQCALQGVHKKDMQRQWTGFGLPVERSSLEVSQAGQSSIELRRSPCACVKPRQFCSRCSASKQSDVMSLCNTCRTIIPLVLYLSVTNVSKGMTPVCRLNR